MIEPRPDTRSLFPVRSPGDAELVASGRQGRPATTPSASHHGTDLAAGWPPSDRPAIDFVQYGDLPQSGFELRPGERVVNVELYLRRLREDLARGPDGPCAASARRDCRALRDMFGRATAKG